jgi:hypothetical protein
MIGVAFILFPVALAVVSRFRLQRILRSGESATSGFRGRVTVESTDHAKALAALEQALTGSRRVRFTWRGWLYCFGVAGALAIVLFFLNRLLQGGVASLQTHLPGVGVFAFFLGMCVIFPAIAYENGDC